MRTEGCQRRSSLTLPTLTAFVFLSRYHFDHIVQSNDLTENITHDMYAGGLLVEDLGICDLDKIFLKKLLEERHSHKIYKLKALLCKSALFVCLDI